MIDAYRLGKQALQVGKQSSLQPWCFLLISERGA